VQSTFDLLSEALHGRYEIQRELGRGAMATVYLARDLRHERPVALKVMNPALSLGVERFMLEIRMVARLRHPHILPLHDSGKAGDLVYYVMPYVEGETLQQRIQRDGPLSLNVALRIGGEVADALAYAHKHGVIHRDIKPANILIEDGHAVVTDFGIALAITAAGDPRLTSSGMAIGTPAYMSPEQIAGGGSLDGRSDVYSLACVLYETLSGRSPFEGDNVMAVMAKRMAYGAPALRTVVPSVPADVEAIIAKALERDPAERLASDEMAVALRTASTAAHPVGMPAVFRSVSNPVPAIAVLPFANMSPEKENEYFADGITEEIINALTKLDGLRVASRTSAFAFKGKDTDVRRIGEQLNVSTVLEGSVRRSGNRLRVTAELVNVRDGYHLWSERFDREMHDVFAIQDEIAHAIVETLKVKLRSPSDSQLVKAQTKNLDAYRLYVEGRYHWNRRGEGLLRAIECFDRAIMLDPQYAAAHAGLAESHVLIGWYRMASPRQAFPTAKAAAARALSIDDELAEAHNALAFVNMCFDWDWDAAEREFLRALQLNRGYASARHWYSEFLIARGRLSEALDQAYAAQELDPLGLIMNAVVAMANYYKRDFSTAISACERSLHMDPTFTPVMLWLGLSHLALGNNVKAARVFDEERRLSSGRLTTVAFCGVAYARNGQLREAEAALAELTVAARNQYIAAFDFVILEEALRRRDRALAALERALAERSTMLTWMQHDPLFDSLREEPAFARVATRISTGGTSL
jgi:serine/threonine-protein kinase